MDTGTRPCHCQPLEEPTGEGPSANTSPATTCAPQNTAPSSKNFEGDRRNPRRSPCFPAMYEGVQDSKIYSKTTKLCDYSSYPTLTQRSIHSVMITLFEGRAAKSRTSETHPNEANAKKWRSNGGLLTQIDRL